MIPLDKQRVCADCGHAEGYHNPPVPPEFPYNLRDSCIGICDRVVLNSASRGKRLIALRDKDQAQEMFKDWANAHSHNGDQPISMQGALEVKLLICNCRKFVEPK